MFIIFDLEAESTGIPKRSLGEIIQIGCVFVSDQFEILGTFKRNIRPTKDPVLSTYIKKLTGISQDDVDVSNDLKYVLNELQLRCIEDFQMYLHQMTTICWGDDRGFLKRECVAKGIHFPLGSDNIDLQRKFSSHYKIKRCGLKRALEICAITPSGIAHDALSDAENTSKIFIKWFP